MKPRCGWFDLALAAGLTIFSAYRLANGNALSVLLAAQSLLVAGLLLIRRVPREEARWPIRLFAWWSAYIPLLMVPGPNSAVPMLLQAAGLLLALGAQAFLGRSFGIAPADRQLVAAGPYRWLRHPVYAGELLSFVGVWLSAPTAWNSGLLALITASVAGRIQAEEKVIDGYAGYSARVRWRLVPGIW